MLATFATTMTPILGDYIYVGGGFLAVIVIVLVVVLVLRRK